MKKSTVYNFLKCMDDTKSYMYHVENLLLECRVYSYDKDVYFAIKVGVDLWRVNKEFFNEYCKLYEPKEVIA